MDTSYEYLSPPIMAKVSTMTTADFIWVPDVLSSCLASHHAGLWKTRSTFCLDLGISLSNMKHGKPLYAVPLWLGDEMVAPPPFDGWDSLSYCVGGGDLITPPATCLLIIRKWYGTKVRYGLTAWQCYLCKKLLFTSNFHACSVFFCCDYVLCDR